MIVVMAMRDAPVGDGRSYGPYVRTQSYDYNVIYSLNKNCIAHYSER